MSIRVTCNSCGAVLKTKDSMAGKVAKCPHCGGRVQIPHPEEEIFDAEEVADDEFDFGDMDPSAGMPVERDDRKPCPACGEMIMRKAAKCRYCGEIFDPALKKRARRSRSSRGGYDDVDEDMTTGDWVVAILCSGIGCIVGIIWMIQGKPKGPKMFGMSILFAIMWNIIRFALEEGMR